jgi:hypothetical protein
MIRPEAGHVYLEVAVSLKNISAQNQTLYSSIQFALHDLAGHAYLGTYLAPVHPPEMYAVDNTIRVGATVHGQLTYDVPANIHQYTLSFKADWKSSFPKAGNKVSWNIDLPFSAIPGEPSSIAMPSPGTSSYPMLKQSYAGTVVNTTHAPAVSAPVTIKILSQNGQGSLSGYVLVGSPLEESGSFRGQVGRDASLHFTVVLNEGSPYASIDFRGKVEPDGTLGGFYVGTTQIGIWKASPL